MATGKMRVLYFSSKGKIAALAETICEHLSIKSDVIPPAYPCENEKIVFIGISVGKEAPDKLRQFCMQLNKTRAQNVAFFVDGKPSDAAAVMNYVREAGARVLDEPFYCKGGFSLPFLKSASGDEKNEIKAWADKQVAAVN